MLQDNIQWLHSYGTRSDEPNTATEVHFSTNEFRLCRTLYATAALFDAEQILYDYRLIFDAMPTCLEEFRRNVTGMTFRKSVKLFSPEFCRTIRLSFNSNIAMEQNAK